MNADGCYFKGNPNFGSEWPVQCDDGCSLKSLRIVWGRRNFPVGKWSCGDLHSCRKKIAIFFSLCFSLQKRMTENSVCNIIWHKNSNFLVNSLYAQLRSVLFHCHICRHSGDLLFPLNRALFSLWTLSNPTVIHMIFILSDSIRGWNRWEYQEFYVRTSVNMPPLWTTWMPSSPCQSPGT